MAPATPHRKELVVGKLTGKQRKALPASDFGLPSERKYPVDTPGRARAAKSRASEMERKGRISKAQEQRIDAKADKRLGKKGGKK